MRMQDMPTTPPYEPPVPPVEGEQNRATTTAPDSAHSDSTDRSVDAARHARQKSRCHISRGEQIADIVFSVVWISMAASWTNLVALFDRLGLPAETPIPSPELISHYYIWIVNVALVGIAVSVLKIVIGRWNFPVGIAHTVYQSMNAMLTVTILNSGMLLRPETAQRWAELSKTSTVTEVVAAVDTWGAIIGVLISLAITLDIIVRWVDIARCGSGSAE